MTIRGTDTEIDSANVIERIAELEDELRRQGDKSWRIIRNRTGTVLTDGSPDGAEPRTFRTSFEARAFLDTGDYNQDRFEIRYVPAGLSENDSAELNRLRELDRDGQDTFGVLAWRDLGVLLRPDGYFDEDWAKDQARDELGIGRSRLDEWPLNLVDWDDAAQQRLDGSYSKVAFEGNDFYGRN